MSIDLGLFQSILKLYAAFFAQVDMLVFFLPPKRVEKSKKMTFIVIIPHFVFPFTTFPPPVARPILITPLARTERHSIRLPDEQMLCLAEEANINTNNFRVGFILFV